MDRNNAMQIVIIVVDTSLSARRAWIEIEAPSSAPYAESVALRKESVDRNCEGVFFLKKITMSLSARRAWIEIFGRAYFYRSDCRRSPQGERG